MRPCARVPVCFFLAHDVQICCLLRRPFLQRRQAVERQWRRVSLMVLMSSLFLSMMTASLYVVFCFILLFYGRAGGGGRKVQKQSMIYNTVVQASKHLPRLTYLYGILTHGYGSSESLNLWFLSGHSHKKSYCWKGGSILLTHYYRQAVMVL